MRPRRTLAPSRTLAILLLALVPVLAGAQEFGQRRATCGTLPYMENRELRISVLERQVSTGPRAVVELESYEGRYHPIQRRAALDRAAWEKLKRLMTEALARVGSMPPGGEAVLGAVPAIAGLSPTGVQEVSVGALRGEDGRSLVALVFSGRGRSVATFMLQDRSRHASARDFWNVVARVDAELARIPPDPAPVVAPPPPAPPSPSVADLAARRVRTGDLLRRSGALDKKIAGLRSGLDKMPAREAVGYSVAYAEDARRLLDELKATGIETPCDAAAELALSAQVERLQALRGALEFQAQYGRGPAASRWELVTAADGRYRQALQEAWRACSPAAP